MWVDCKQFLKMHFRNSAVSEVPALLIFLELKTETEVPGYLRPHYVKKSGKWKLNKVYIQCLLYSFELFLKTGIGVCKPCFVFSLSCHTNQSLQPCLWEPLPPQSWRVWLFPGGGGGVTLFRQTPLVMAQLVKQSVVRSEEHVWLDLCSLFQMWTNVSCSVACVVKPSVKM